MRFASRRRSPGSAWWTPSRRWLMTQGWRSPRRGPADTRGSEAGSIRPWCRSSVLGLACDDEHASWTARRLPRAVPRQAYRYQLFEDFGEEEPLGADLHHRLSRGDLATVQAPGRRPVGGRSLRALHRRHGGRQRLLGAERPPRAARPLPRPAPAAGGRRRRGAPHGRRLHPRPRPRHAADRRLRRRDRSPRHDPHRLPLDPRRDPLPAHAPRGRPEKPTDAV